MRSPLMELLAIFSLFGLGACDEKIPLKLTSQQADLADTIFLKEAQTIRPLLDSLCEATFDGRVERAVDSMLVIRRKEEEELRARLRKLGEGDE